MDTLVSTDWLADHIDDPDLVVLDCTVTLRPIEGGGMEMESGRGAYDRGHIPRAGFADLIEDLADTGSPHRFAVPEPAEFSAAMGALGVGDDSRVVLYDGNHAMWAARVWWMLRWAGFDRAALLDGGQRVWTAEERPLSVEPPSHPTRTLTPASRPGLIADQGEVRAAVDDGQVCLLDSLFEAQYTGEVAMYERPGHIPGAANVSAMGLLDGSGRFRPEAELAEMHTGDRAARHITYCGGGIAASASAYVMTRLGFSDVAVYTASLQEWAADPANPMVCGP